MIKTFLAAPDRTEPNPHNPGSETQWYDKSRIEFIERSVPFQKAVENGKVRTGEKRKAKTDNIPPEKK